jgi:hypothetical protein
MEFIFDEVQRRSSADRFAFNGNEIFEMKVEDLVRESKIPQGV